MIKPRYTSPLCVAVSPSANNAHSFALRLRCALFSGLLVLSCTAALALGSTLIFDSSVPTAEKIRLMEAGQHHPVWELNEWVNSFLFPASFMAWVTETVGVSVSHYLLTDRKSTRLNSSH